MKMLYFLPQNKMINVGNKDWKKKKSGFSCTSSEPQMQLFLYLGLDHKVSSVLIRWNEKGCNPYSDQRH